MIERRPYRPVIDHTKCGTCRVCLCQCPAELLIEQRLEPDTLRGRIYGGNASRPLVKEEEGCRPPCQTACPIGQDVRTYVGLIAQGKLREALEVIRETNPLPAICGYVCHHPCEEACLRGLVDAPVAIRELKGVAATQGSWKENIHPSRDGTGRKKVAVIGAGPTGLAAAHDLVRLGYRVVLFESLPLPGGMLEVGIPPFRLPRDILKAEIDRILALGVELRTGLTLGRDFTMEDLREEGFGATLLATGAHRPRRLKIEGETLKGIMGGVEFLRKANLDQGASVGAKVAVIGGGNVAIDSARCAVRLGAREVEIYYRRTRREMPAMAEEVREAQGEGVHIHWLTRPKAFVGEKGRVRGMICLKNRLGRKDASGRRAPVPIEGSEFPVETDTVIVAVGEEPGVADLGVGIDLTGGGTIAVDRRTAATSLPGVFAGGDVVTGPGWAVDAIAWGKKAAQGIHAYLSGL